MNATEPADALDVIESILHNLDSHVPDVQEKVGKALALIPALREKLAAQGAEETAMEMAMEAIESILPGIINSENRHVDHREWSNVLSYRIPRLQKALDALRSLTFHPAPARAEQLAQGEGLDVEALKLAVYRHHLKDGTDWTDEAIAEAEAEKGDDMEYGFQYGAEQSVNRAIDYLAANGHLSRPAAPVIGREDLEKVRKEISNVANQTAFSSMARAGDPSQLDALKMEAMWAGTLQKALAIIDQMQKESGG